MKRLQLTTIAAVLVVGCATTQQPEPSTTKAQDISIHDAAADGNIEAVNQHLEVGADVNARENNKWTPLHYAAFGGHKEVVELLIAKGADVNLDQTDVYDFSYDGRTPLDVASQYKETEIADFIREHGGKSGAEDSLHVAVWVRNIEAVKQHLASGVNVNAKIKHGSTPLHNAAKEGHNEIAELLIAGSAEVNAKDNYGKTPLHRAVQEGYMEIVELLIAKGADVNATNMYRITPLDVAEEFNLSELASILRKHGGKTKKELEAAELGVSVEHLPRISIHDAAGAAGRKGNMEAVKQHLAAGKDVDARDKQDKTPLQHAAYWGHKEIAELLIAKGADINAKDNAGTTTLVWAVLGGKKESVELLIVNGVDVNAKSNYGTPLDVAIKFKKTETADLLRKHGGKTGKELKAEGK